MQTNRIIPALLLASLALPLVHCGGDARHDVGEAYFLVATNRKIPYWQAAGAGFGQGAAQLQVKYEMVGPETYDPQGQKQEFERLLGARIKPTGILVSPADPEVMTPAIDRAISEGIPVITIDSDAPKSKRLLFIGTNNYEAGRMGGEVAARALNGKGSVVIFTIAGQLNLKERLNGYEQVFRGYPGIKIAEVVDIKGQPSIAFDRANEILEKGKPEVNAFVCLEALACPEVAEVVNRRGAKEVIVAMDTDPRTLEWIQKGVIAATVAQKPFTMASFGVKILDDLYHHKPPSLLANFAQDTRSPLPSLIDTGATLVDKSNVSAFQKAETAQKAG